MTINQSRADQASASQWPHQLSRAVADVLVDTLAWAAGFLVIRLSGLDWTGTAGFAFAAAMTHLAIGQATARSGPRSRTAALSLIVAVTVASGFALAVSAQIPVDWGACSVLAASVAAVSVGTRAICARVRRVFPVRPPEPATMCSFAETLGPQWLPQPGLSAAQSVRQAQLAGSDRGAVSFTSQLVHRPSAAARASSMRSTC